MLSRTSYAQADVDACRAEVDAQLAHLRCLLAATRDRPEVAEAATGLERALCHDLVLVLDRWFVHRGRGQEGKDGNPLNEVRLLCDALVLHGGVVPADKTIKRKAEGSVLGLVPGDEVHLREPEITRLAAAFLAEIEARFPEG